jgi:hypothetical protein
VSDNRVIRRVEGLPFQTIEGKVLVVVPRSQAIHMLNETASRLWDLLEKGDTVDGLVGTLCREYDVATETARRDVEEAVGEMRQKGLVE